MAINNFPDLGTNVRVVMSNGSEFTGYWDGLQWWVGINNDPNDLPVENDFVVRWRQLQVDES